MSVIVTILICAAFFIAGVIVAFKVIERYMIIGEQYKNMRLSMNGAYAWIPIIIGIIVLYALRISEINMEYTMWLYLLSPWYTAASIHAANLFHKKRLKGIGSYKQD